MNTEYGADQIQILEGLEAVRKRPGMYIGSTSARGLHHLVYEIVDNSVDEALAGFCKNIDVSINEDNSITVIDDGRGIPVGINHKAGIPAVEVVFTILHAGGKFGGGGYKVSGGLHGVGASVVNALSEWLEVTIYIDGKIYRQRYERGHVIYKLKEIGTCDPEKTGTTVVFLPDKEIFEETVFDYDTLKIRLREMAFLTKGLNIILRDKREENEVVKEFCYEGGIRQFVEYLNRSKTSLYCSRYRSRIRRPGWFSSRPQPVSLPFVSQGPAAGSTPDPARRPSPASARPELSGRLSPLPLPALLSARS